MMDQKFIEILRLRAPSVLPEGAPEIGFDCGVGWFPLLYDLVTALQLWNQARGIPEQDVIAVQIKEKFGGLRFYIKGGGPDVEAVYKTIAAAEASSMSTCEDCGAPGQQCTIGSWIRVLCREHAAKANWWRTERLTLAGLAND